MASLNGRRLQGASSIAFSSAVAEGIEIAAIDCFRKIGRTRTVVPTIAPAAIEPITTCRKRNLEGIRPPDSGVSELSIIALGSRGADKKRERYIDELQRTTAPNFQLDERTTNMLASSVSSRRAIPAAVWYTLAVFGFALIVVLVQLALYT